MLKDNDYEEVEPFLDANGLTLSSRHPPCRTISLLPWAVAALSWLITIYALFQKDYVDTRTSNSTSIISSQSDDDGRTNGIYFPTDFEAMRSVISYESRVFTGALYYDAVAGKYIRNTTHNGPEYVGPPSEAIDTAWEALLEKEWAPLTDEEAAPFLPELIPFPRYPKPSMYMFEPDMFHSLHCLNEVRKRIDVEYYRSPGHEGIVIDQEDWDRIHIDHCLDQLRQAIMCFGDLSPVPLYYVDGTPLGIGRGTTHTCRKWDPIKQWKDERNVEMNNTRKFA